MAKDKKIVEPIDAPFDDVAGAMFHGTRPKKAPPPKTDDSAKQVSPERVMALNMKLAIDDHAFSLKGEGKSDQPPRSPSPKEAISLSPVRRLPSDQDEK